MKTKTIITALLLCVTIGVLADEPKALLESVLIEKGTLQHKYDYTYNQNGTLASDVYSLSVYGTWVPDEKNEYTYNESGEIIYSETFRWETDIKTDIKSWHKTMKSYYAYNEHGDQIVRTDSMWGADSEQWWFYSQYKTLYTYDTYDRMATSIDTFFYSPSHMVLEMTKCVFTYDEAGTLISIDKYSANPGEDEWLTNSKSTYTYDAGGNLIEIMTCVWRSIEGIWKNSTRDEMTYDVNGYLITEVNSEWKDAGEWSQVSKKSYYYHGYNTALEQVETSVNVKGTKLLRDGQMIIEHGGKTYSVTGQEVK